MNKEKKEYVLYKGEKFTVEWYYTEKNKSQPFEYFNSLDSQQQMKLLYLVKRMGDFGKISDKTKFNFEEDGIWAFKPKPDRFLSFFTTLMQDPKFKDEFEKGYNEFLISEFMIEKMEEENISVRELAKEAKVSPTTIQNLRSGNAESVKYKTLSTIMQKLGYALQPVKMATL